MCMKNETETGNNNEHYLYGQGKTASSTDSTTDGFYCGGSSNHNVLANHFGDYSNILSVVEHLIADGIRNFFSAPENRNDITEYLTQQMVQKKPQRFSAVRDISNNEILRPRDLPQATGLGKTSIWRLEKEGKFVTKLKLSNGCVGYLRSDVESWLISKQIMERGGK